MSRRNRLLCIGLLAVSQFIAACGGGTRAVETGITPRRSVAAQPRLDASGQVRTASIAVPEGSEFQVMTVDPLSSATAADGDPVSLEVADNVMVNGVVAIAAGTRARAVVTNVKRAGRMGTSGSISLRVETATAVDGQRVKLRATKAAESDSRVGSTIALAVILSPLFLLRKGQDVHYKPGTPITVFTDEQITVRGWQQ